MSYEQLAQHAARIQQLAIQESLKQRGWIEVDDDQIKPPPDVTQQIADGMVASAERQFSIAVAMFEPFLTMPDPSRFQPMIDYLGAAMNTLSSGEGTTDPVNHVKVTANPGLDAMTTVSQKIEDWRGSAAVAFRQNFVEPFPAITANQFALVATLNGAIEAEQALWAECRKNVDDIAEKAIKALEVMDECSHDDEVCVLTVASSVFAVAAALATGGAMIALTVVGAAAQAQSGVPAGNDPEVQFDGQTPEAIVNQVHDALNQLATLTNSNEQVIADALTASAETLAANKARFVSRRPALADTTSATVTTSDGLGEAV
ncbi:MAG: hypothetical protein QOE51_1451 [Actinoplanes sp.]|jgi:hypothetical protein|nr:hypothetical protein [Actinoplanes sp.]